MRKTLLIVVGLLTVFMLVSGTIAAEENTITKLSVDGNQHIAAEKILDQVEAKSGDIFDKEALRNDLKNIMDLGYFQDVSASFKHHEGGLEVIFKVVENPLIKEVKIEGNEVYTKEKLIDLIGVQKGQVLNVKQLNNGLKNAQQKYQDEGYIMAGIKNVNIDKDGILNIKLNVGHLNEIKINGNTKTKDFVILRNLDLEEGQILNVEDIQNAYRKLYRLQYFKKIKPNLQKVEGKSNTANLVIDLEEGETGQFNFGGGYSTKDGWLGYLNVKEKNLLGRGQNLSFNYEFGKNTTYSLNFYEPWLLGTENSFGISVYNRKSENEHSLKGTYHEDRQGGSITLGRPITDMWEGNVKLKAEKTSTDWVKDQYTDENGDTRDLSDTSNSTRSITLRLNRDTTNKSFNPTKGAIDIFSTEFAGGIMGGDNEFSKYNMDIRRYYPGFKNQHAWALRMKTGIGEGEIPTQDKYRLGGSKTLRGYESNIVGENMMLLSAEYRFPIVDKITGVVFSDNGNAWEDKGEIALDDLNSSAGLGVMMNTPLGQIKLDYGWNEEGNGKFHFSLGNAF